MSPHPPGGAAAPECAFVLHTATLAEPFSLLPTTDTNDFDRVGQTPAVQSVPEFLDLLLASRLVCPHELEKVLGGSGSLDDTDVPRLTAALVEQGLLTDYQVNRLRAGQTFGLVLGNYRILGRLGAGGMGVVYKAEHLLLKRLAALKVLTLEEDHDQLFLRRFASEMQAVATLHHPNIVLAFDASEVPVPGPRQGTLRYLAMEYAPGQTLDDYVRDEGPLPVARACHYVTQAAQGLQHAHERGLVHRDIKPSNLMRTPRDEIKILDFGLARLFRRRHTEAFTILGTLDYLAPEQARDARSADIRADVYGLGGTLYWLLTGRKPFPGNRPVLQELIARQRERPVPLRQVRPDLPAELEVVLGRMMAPDPEQRYPTPQAVASALTAFRESASRPAPASPEERAGAHAPARPAECGERTRRVLVASADGDFRAACRAALESHGIECLEAREKDEVHGALARVPCDAVLIDVRLPNHAGPRLCHELRGQPPGPHLKIALLTAEQSAEFFTAARKVGADDTVPVAAAPAELAGRVRTLLRLKEAEERADAFAGHLLQTNRRLEQTQLSRDTDLNQAQDVLIFAMAKMAELRGLEPAGHLRRMQQYARVLAEEAMRLPAFAGRIDEPFVEMLERCVPLHDIGKVALPDHVLLKPGKFDGEERAIMESHASLGADILAAVARQHGAPLAFLPMATDITRHHHERYDGSGYPDGLTGEAIPLAARFVALADVYDALRSKLVYKPGLTHAAARRLLLEGSAGQFDAALLVAFRRCEATFEQIFAQVTD